MSIMAEQSVIGSLLMDQECIADVYSILEPQMFTVELFGKVYHEYQKAYDNHYDLSFSDIEQKLRSDSFPSDIIVEQLKTCLSSTITSVFIKQDANVIVNDYKAHRLDKFLNSIKVSPTNLKEQIRALQEELEVLQDKRQEKSKTLAEITKENKSALQFLDLMTTIDKYSELSGDLLKEKLQAFVKAINIDFEIVKKYISLFPDKVYRNIYQGGLMIELV